MWMRKAIMLIVRTMYEILLVMQDKESRSVFYRIVIILWAEQQQIFLMENCRALIILLAIPLPLPLFRIIPAQTKEGPCCKLYMTLHPKHNYFLQQQTMAQP